MLSKTALIFLGIIAGLLLIVAIVVKANIFTIISLILSAATITALYLRKKKEDR